jgi:OOP family OmpA-OmpF porin
VHFDTNSIEPKDKAWIKKLAERMAGKKALVVIGHADSAGGDDYNDKLSVRRANRVKELLVTNGVDAKIVQISGKGEKEPIADNNTADGRALNRRAIVQGEDYVDGN